MTRREMLAGHRIHSLPGSGPTQPAFCAEVRCSRTWEASRQASASLARRQVRHPGALPQPWPRRRAGEPAFTGPEAAVQLRKKLDGYGMRVIISLAPPKDAGTAGYEAAVRAVSELGAVTTHASFTARRYEEFETFEAFKASFERHQRSVELAEPVLRKHKVKLAIENHKGWRAAEHVAWIKQLGSEWVGACYDFGNNISLCEDPAETLVSSRRSRSTSASRTWPWRRTRKGSCSRRWRSARGCSTSPAWSRCSSRRIQT